MTRNEYRPVRSRTTGSSTRFELGVPGLRPADTDRRREPARLADRRAVRADRPRGVLPGEGRIDARREEDLHHVRGQGPVPRIRAAERRALRHLGRPVRARAPSAAQRAHRLSRRFERRAPACQPASSREACPGAASARRARLASKRCSRESPRSSSCATARTLAGPHPRGPRGQTRPARRRRARRLPPRRDGECRAPDGGRARPGS